MGARPAYTRGEESFVPPEEVMTRLMRRPDRRTDAAWFGYLLLGIFMAGVLVGLFLAGGG